METELKPINPEPTHNINSSNNNHHHQTDSNRDDRPLLKSDSSNSTTNVQNNSLTTGESMEELEKKYAAYVRHDVYGPMGRGEVPVAEKLLLGIALVTLVPIRFVISLAIMVLYFVICRVCTVFRSAENNGVGGGGIGSGREEEEEVVVEGGFARIGGWRRNVIVGSGRFLSRMLLFVIGFYWIKESYRDVDGIQHPYRNSIQNGREGQSVEPKRPGAIVSNHVSYLDILYHMSASFPSFVAKRSVGKLPLVGLISNCLGCVYVQRESKTPDFKGVSGVVTERVKEAHENRSAPMMLLFPEGTTTNGDFLLPFKSGAFIAGVPVQPVILRYPYQRFSLAWDSISGVRHMILLLCQFINFVEVTWLPVYYPSPEEKNDPKLYADNIRSLMAREGNLIMSDIGLTEKRIYLAAVNGLI